MCPENLSRLLKPSISKKNKNKNLGWLLCLMIAPAAGDFQYPKGLSHLSQNYLRFSVSVFCSQQNVEPTRFQNCRYFQGMRNSLFASNVRKDPTTGHALSCHTYRQSKASRSEQTCLNVPMLLTNLDDRPIRSEKRSSRIGSKTLVRDWDYLFQSPRRKM